MSRRELRNIAGVRLTANAAQLSIRDLRLRPLRPLPQTPELGVESPLENALRAYLEGIDEPAQKA